MSTDRRENRRRFLRRLLRGEQSHRPTENDAFPWDEVLEDQADTEADAGRSGGPGPARGSTGDLNGGSDPGKDASGPLGPDAYHPRSSAARNPMDPFRRPAQQPGPEDPGAATPFRPWEPWGPGFASVQRGTDPAVGWLQNKLAEVRAARAERLRMDMMEERQRPRRTSPGAVAEDFRDPSPATSLSPQVADEDIASILGDPSADTQDEAPQAPQETFESPNDAVEIDEVLSVEDLLVDTPPAVPGPPEETTGTPVEEDTRQVTDEDILSILEDVPAGAAEATGPAQAEAPQDDADLIGEAGDSPDAAEDVLSILEDVPAGPAEATGPAEAEAPQDDADLIGEAVDSPDATEDVLSVLEDVPAGPTETTEPAQAEAPQDDADLIGEASDSPEAPIIEDVIQPAAFAEEAGPVDVAETGSAVDAADTLVDGTEASAPAPGVPAPTPPPDLEPPPDEDRLEEFIAVFEDEPVDEPAAETPEEAPARPRRGRGLLARFKQDKTQPADKRDAEVPLAPQQAPDEETARHRWVRVLLARLGLGKTLPAEERHVEAPLAPQQAPDEATAGPRRVRGLLARFKRDKTQPAEERHVEASLAPQQAPDEAPAGPRQGRGLLARFKRDKTQPAEERDAEVPASPEDGHATAGPYEDGAREADDDDVLSILGEGVSDDLLRDILKSPPDPQTAGPAGEQDDETEPEVTDEDLLAALGDDLDDDLIQELLEAPPGVPEREAAEGQSGSENDAAPPVADNQDQYAEGLAEDPVADTDSAETGEEASDAGGVEAPAPSEQQDSVPAQYDGPSQGDTDAGGPGPETTLVHQEVLINLGTILMGSNISGGIAQEPPGTFVDISPEVDGGTTTDEPPAEEDLEDFIDEPRALPEPSDEPRSGPEWFGRHTLNDGSALDSPAEEAVQPPALGPAQDSGEQGTIGQGEMSEDDLWRELAKELDFDLPEGLELPIEEPGELPQTSQLPELETQASEPGVSEGEGPLFDMPDELMSPGVISGDELDDPAFDEARLLALLEDSSQQPKALAPPPEGAQDFAEPPQTEQVAPPAQEGESLPAVYEGGLEAQPGPEADLDGLDDLFATDFTMNDADDDLGLGEGSFVPLGALPDPNATEVVADDIADIPELAEVPDLSELDVYEPADAPPAPDNLQVSVVDGEVSIRGIRDAQGAIALGPATGAEGEEEEEVHAEWEVYRTAPKNPLTLFKSIAAIGRKRTVTASMENGVLRVVVFSGRSVLAWGRANLDEAEDGQTGKPARIGDQKLYSAKMRVLLEGLIGRMSRVVTDLPLYAPLLRRIVLPKMRRGHMTQILMPEVAETLPFEEDEVDIKWHVRKEGLDRDVLVTAVPKSIIDAHAEMFKGAQAPALGIYSKALALSMISDNPDLIAVHLSKAEAAIVIVQDNVPQIVHRLDLRRHEGTELEIDVDEEGLSERELADIVANAIDQAHGYLQMSEGSAETRIFPVMLTGELAEDYGFVATLQRTLTLHVLPFTPPFDYPEDFPIHEYAINMGLMLSDSASKDSGKTITAGQTPVLNLVSERHLPRSLPLAQAGAFTLLLMLSVLASNLTPLVNNAVADAAVISKQHDAMKAQARKHKLETTRLNALRSEIGTYNEDTLAMKERLLTIENDLFALLAHSVTITSEALPPGAEVTVLAPTEGGYGVIGRASSYDKVVEYSERLMESPWFSEVRIGSAGGSSGGEGGSVNFQLEVTIAEEQPEDDETGEGVESGGG